MPLEPAAEKQNSIITHQGTRNRLQGVATPIYSFEFIKAGFGVIAPGS